MLHMHWLDAGHHAVDHSRMHEHDARQKRPMSGDGQGKEGEKGTTSRSIMSQPNKLLTWFNIWYLLLFSWVLHVWTVVQR